MKHHTQVKRSRRVEAFDSDTQVIRTLKKWLALIGRWWRQLFQRPQEADETSPAQPLEALQDDLR
jgi:hypothetical protein